MSTDVTTFAIDTPVQTGFGLPAPALSFLQAQPNNGDLSEFLSRPVEIVSYNWTSALVLNTHIDPWVLYLNNAVVRPKLASFARLRATLNLEIQVNGTPFHYGAILASYEPANNWRSSVDGDYRQHSNLQHGFIDPTASKTVRLTCPFIHPKLWIELNSTAGAQVGVLNLDTVVQLASSSGTVEPITITVYAWMTDVILAIPTSDALATFVAQSKKVVKKKRTGTMVGRDEYEIQPNSGLISSTAHAIATVAGKMTGVPIIGPMATATQIGAGAISTIASLFGYSRATSLEAPAPILSMIGSRFAVTDQVSNAIPLTVGSKSERSIDPRTIGLDTGEDELTIMSIARKPTLMSVSPIGVSASVGTTIIEIPVSPSGMTTNAVVGVDTEYYMSAVHAASIPFEYWSGSLVYRFQVICSKFHRGRLRFQYIPSAGAPTFTNSLNDTYNHIVDISPGKEVEITVPWCAATPMLSTGFPNAPTTNPRNGTLRVTIQNEVSTPDSTTPIMLLSWMYAGDDFKVAVPTSAQYCSAGLAPQSAHDVDDGTTTYESVVFLDAKLGKDFDLAIVADPVESFRPLLKRYTLHRVLGGNLAPTTPNLEYQSRYSRLSGFPQRCGENTWGQWTNAGRQMNGTQNHLANYLEPCFLAKRGGFRWLMDCSALYSNTNARVTRTAPYVGQYTSSNVYAEDTYVNAAVAGVGNSTRNYFGPTGIPQPIDGEYSDLGAGTQLFTSGMDSQRPEVQIMDYFPYRYYCHFGTDFNFYYPRQSVYLHVNTHNITGAALEVSDGMIPCYVAAAEDFTMNVFIGIPRFRNLGTGRALVTTSTEHTVRQTALP